MNIVHSKIKIKEIYKTTRYAAFQAEIGDIIRLIYPVDDNGKIIQCTVCRNLSTNRDSYLHPNSLKNVLKKFKYEVISNE